MRSLGAAAILLALLTQPAWAQETPPQQTPPADACPPMDCAPPDMVSLPDENPVQIKTVENPVTYAPTMFGDFLMLAIEPSTNGLVQIRQGDNPYGIQVSRGGYKIAENEAPRPQDRAFVSYNYYDQVSGPVYLNAVHREIAGIEKTFFDGNMSLGIRQPYYQLYGSGISDYGLEDLAGILKVALFNDLRCGNLVSVGVLATIPTGRNDFYSLPNGSSIHPVLIEPFLGYYWSCRRFYIHGFMSAMIPTDSTDVIIAFNDIGVGYSLYQTAGKLITTIIPTAEFHVNTPINKTAASDFLNYKNSLDFTGGVNFVFNHRSSLGLAIGTPMIGPNPFNVEGLANFNWRF